MKIQKKQECIGEFTCSSALEMVHVLSELLLLHSHSEAVFAKNSLIDTADLFTKKQLLEVKTLIMQQSQITCFQKSAHGENDSFEKEVLDKNQLEELLNEGYIAVDSCFIQAEKESQVEEGYSDFSQLKLTEELFPQVLSQYPSKDLLFLSLTLAVEKRRYYLSLVDQIEGVRAKNNVNWMELLRLAFKTDPYEAKKILKNIHRDDGAISSLLAKLSGS